MKLSQKTLDSLVDVLVPEVVKYIEQDSRYVDFMQDVIPDALQEAMGELDENLKFELSMMIMDHITFRCVK